MKSKYLLLIPIVFFGARVSALVEITEIMYDHEGTDTKKEWIEVYNNSESAIDLTTYKLREADTNHAIKSYGGSGLVPARGYGIIADSPIDVESELAGALIFDSSFSLSNSGEELSVINPDGSTDNSILYDVSLGAKGDGNSLQKIDGAWISTSPTPGAENKPGGTEVKTETFSESSSSLDSTKTSSSNSKQKPKTFYLEVTIPNAIFVGENVAFKAKTFDENENELTYSHYRWSFGDGGFSTEANPVHVYDAVGDYIVYIESTSGIYTETNKQRIHVYEKPFIIDSVSGDNLVIKNISSNETDIGGWSVMSGGLLYIFPKHTYLLGKSSLRVSSNITGFVFGYDTVLASPSGGIIGVVQKVTTEPSSGVKLSQQASFSKAGSVHSNATVETGDNKPLQASVAASGTKTGTWIWLSMFGLVLSLGLVLLYFLQKKHTLIDEIEIIE